MIMLVFSSATIISGQQKGVVIVSRSGDSRVTQLLHRDLLQASASGGVGLSPGLSAASRAGPLWKYSTSPVNITAGANNESTDPQGGLAMLV